MTEFLLLMILVINGDQVAVEPVAKYKTRQECMYHGNVILSRWKYKTVIPTAVTCSRTGDV